MLQTPGLGSITSLSVILMHRGIFKAPEAMVAQENLTELQEAI